MKSRKKEVRCIVTQQSPSWAVRFTLLIVRRAYTLSRCSKTACRVSRHPEVGLSGVVLPMPAPFLQRYASISSTGLHQGLSIWKAHSKELGGAYAFCLHNGSQLFLESVFDVSQFTWPRSHSCIRQKFFLILQIRRLWLRHAKELAQSLIAGGDRVGTLVCLSLGLGIFRPYFAFLIISSSVRIFHQIAGYPGTMSYSFLNPQQID